MNRFRLFSAIFTSCILSTHSFAQNNSMCLSADSDTDGDGWGWEDGESCIVTTIDPENSVKRLNRCSVGFSDGLPYCWNTDQVSDPLPDLVECEDPDGDGWGWNDHIVNRFPGIGSCKALPNLVHNGSFNNGSEGWNTYLHPDSVYGTDSLAPYASNFTFLTPPLSMYPRVSFGWRRAGTQHWHSQLFTDPISLEGDRTYRLSFTVGTEFTRTGSAVGSVVVENGTDYTKYLDRHDFTVPSSETRPIYYKEFFVPTSDSNVRVTFNLGDNYGANHQGLTGSLSIDSVQLVALNSDDDGQVDPGNCDYTNASLYGGWGWDAVARESCPPLRNMAVQSQCEDTDGDGYGWNGVETCEP